MKQTRAGAAALILAGLLVSGAGCGPAPKGPDPGVESAVGQVVGERFGELAQGRRVVLISNTGNAHGQALTTGVRVALEQNGFEVLGVQEPLPNVDPLDVRDPVNAVAFSEALNKYQKVEVVISLVGLPGPTSGGVPERVPGVEVFVLHSGHLPELANLIRHGSADGIIAARADADWSETDGSPEIIFESRYVLITAENLVEATRLGRIGVASPGEPLR